MFCAQGTGFLVEWDEVKNYMHVESYLKKSHLDVTNPKYKSYSEERSISLEEIDQIINKTFYANQGRKAVWKREKTYYESNHKPAANTSRPKEAKADYLLVDGYNIIFAWPELKELADENMDSAKIKLLDILSNYQSIRKCVIIAVFDAYRVQGHREEVIDYYNIHLVYTREAQTADNYIEKFAHDNKKNYNITVATSDGLQQMIVRGEGCSLLSARELQAEIVGANNKMMTEYREMIGIDRNYLVDALPQEVKKKMEGMVKKEDNK